MATFQDIMNAAKQKGQQQQILAQPSIMDKATDENGNDVDPQGTDKIQHAQMIQDAVNNGVGQAMGTISVPKIPGMGAAVEDAGMSMADRIKQAAGNSDVKVIPSIYDNQLAQYADRAASQPQFGEGNVNPGRNVPDQQLQKFQTGLRDQAMQERSAKQLADRKNIMFQQLMQSLKGNK